MQSTPGAVALMEHDRAVTDNTVAAQEVQKAVAQQKIASIMLAVVKGTPATTPSP